MRGALYLQVAAPAFLGFVRRSGKLGFAGVAVAFAQLVCVFVPGSYAQTPARSTAQPMIVRPVDDTDRQNLSGNTRPEARISANDRGLVSDSLPMSHMLLQLRRPAAQEQALETLIGQLHDPKSPNYHHWVSAQEIGAQFGPAQQDIQTVTGWLQREGFTVNTVYPNGLVIDFSGTAGGVRNVFRTEIHYLSVHGVTRFANMSDPQIPAALAPAIVGIVSLNNIPPQRPLRPKPQYTFGSGKYVVTPADLATIYTFNTLFSAGTTGKGQTIYLIEDTDLYTNSDWSTFRSTFGLSSYSGASLNTVHPQPSSGPSNCSDPGINSDDGEAILDAEWASAAAPGAAIVMATCQNTFTFGGLIAIENLINAANPPAIISLSYLNCEAANGSSGNAAFNSIYEQGVAEGTSIFVAAGDNDAAGCDDFNTATAASMGIAVNGFASTPYNVAVGGTDFSDTYSHTNSTYWNSSNTATYGSAKSYIPEIPWNDSCGSELIASYLGYPTTYGSLGLCNSGAAKTYGLLNIVGGSGGPSQVYAKPSWQTGLVGNPADGARDLPDISLFAASGVWGHYYVFCWSDTANGGTPCTGAPSNWSGAGGTSFASPIWAGIQALINQYTGATQGNPNIVYYKLAASEYGTTGSTSCNSSNGNSVSSSCIFYNVTLGDNDADCSNNSPNCYLPSGTYGVLSTSTSSYAPAYKTQAGWNFPTGIGTVNAYNLVTHWASAAGNTALIVSVTGSGTVGSNPSGISCPSNCTADFAGGTQVTLSATPASGWIFSGWGGACSGSGACTVTMNAAESVSATFTQQFTLSVTETGSGTVTSTPSGINCGFTCSASFASGTQVTLGATPASGWIFSGWGGACSGTGSCVVTMSSTQSVSATFTQSGYTLSVSVSGSGTVTSSPSGINCGSTCTSSFASGTQVTLAATRAAGAAFTGWGGACSGTGSCVVTMNATESVSATFSSNGGGTQTAVTLFVNSEVGSDSGSCPQTAPCQSLNYALSEASSGASIVIETGGIFGPIYLTAPIFISGPSDGTAVIQWNNIPPGCIGGAPGSCNGSANASYAVDINAGATASISLKNLVFDNSVGSNGAMHISSAANVTCQSIVVRGGSGVIPQMVLIDSSQGSQLQFYMSAADLAFSGSGGAIYIHPSGATPVAARIVHTDVHDATFGIEVDATALGSGAIIEADTDHSEFFSFSGSAVNVQATSGGNARVVLVRSNIINSGAPAFNVSGVNALGLLYKTTITGNATGVAISSGATVLSYSNNEVFGNGTNVSGSLTKEPPE